MTARPLALGILVLIGWQPNVQVVGTCGDAPTIRAESVDAAAPDSLGPPQGTPEHIGIVVVADAPAPPCHWQTATSGVPDEPALLDPVRWVWTMRRTIGWGWL